MKTNKIDLQEDDKEEETEKLPSFITFTELFSIKQTGLIDIVNKNGSVFLICKEGAVLKITTATLG